MLSPSPKGFLYNPHLKIKYSHVFLSKLLEWRRFVLDDRYDCALFWCALRSAQLEAVWLVKSATYFDLIGHIGGCVRGFQRSKYQFSSHPKTQELVGKCGIKRYAIFLSNWHRIIGFIMPCRDVWNTWPLESPVATKTSSFVVRFCGTGRPLAMYFTHYGRPWLTLITYLAPFRSSHHSSFDILYI